MIEITVRGIPAPQGSKRHVGNGRMIEMSKAVGPWREAIRAETQRIMQSHFIRMDAVSVWIQFLLPRPKGHFGTGRNLGMIRDSSPIRPAGRPDVDKLARAVLDGLTMGGAWKDDGQVVDLKVSKFYAEPGQTPGCHIKITGVAG